jgi:hypothetical protein
MEFKNDELWEIYFTYKTSHVCRYNKKEISNYHFFYDGRTKKSRQYLYFLKQTRYFHHWGRFIKSLNFHCSHCNVYVITEILSIDDLIISEDYGFQSMMPFADDISPQSLTQLVNEALLPLRQTVFAWLLSWRRYFPALTKDVALLIAKMIWETRFLNND